MMQDLLTKFKFYQEIQLWPKAADFNYEGWLENFDSDERALAEKIIDFFVYIPDDNRTWGQVPVSPKISSHP